MFVSRPPFLTKRLSASQLTYNVRAGRAPQTPLASDVIQTSSARYG